MTATDAKPNVHVQRKGRTLIISLNRPEVRNAIDKPVAEGLAAALDQLDDDRDLAVGVLTGAGKGFCSGMDLKAFLVHGDPVVEGRGFAGIVERPPEKPLIAAVEGFALAGGLEIALACDLIVASQGAKLGLPEVKRSLVATGGGLRRLPRRVPLGLAIEIALTGEPITAERAYQVGLVNRLVARGEALAQALELAETIAAAGPLALAATKQVIYQQANWSDEEFWERQEQLAGAVGLSRDAREGSLAFAEKRDPVWEGR